MELSHRTIGRGGKAMMELYFFGTRQDRSRAALFLNYRRRRPYCAHCAVSTGWGSLGTAAQ